MRGAGGQPRRLFDLLREPHWTLIVRDGNAGALPEPDRMLHVHRIGPGGEFQDAGGHFVAAYGMADGDVLLIRPDGYVGALVAATDRTRFAECRASLRVDAGEHR